VNEAPEGNRYLQGHYAPISTEFTETDLAVTGTIPVELDGRYLRNGPNPLLPPDPDAYHWFLGDAMVHGIRLRDGRAEWYRNRWVRSTAVSEALGEAPAPGERHTFDNANTNVIGHAGRTLALVEAGARPVELTDELETVCHSDLDGTLPYGFSAHPKRDPATGELWTVGYFWGRPNVLDVVVVGADGRVRRRLDVPVPGNPMVHDCSITEKYLVLYDLPVTFNMDMAAGGAMFPYGWDADYGARIGLLPREGTADQVEWFDVDPCYVFHPMNAHDDGDKVVIDLVRHDKMFATDMAGPNEGVPNLWRWTVDRSAGKVTEEQLDDLPIEFPRVDERVVGRKHRFGIANTFVDPGARDLAWDDAGMVRYDLETGARTQVSFGAGRTAGEAIHIPHPDSSAEDAGWYMALVFDRDVDRSELVIMDAAAPDAEPVARVHLPTRVPLGFHGNWVPSA